MLAGTTYDELKESLSVVGDLERILSRVSLRSARPRDLTQLCRAVSVLPAIGKTLATLDSPLLEQLHERIGEHPAIRDLLNRALVESPPMLLRDGGVIAEGFDEALDDLRAIAANADQYLLDLEQRERKQTGIQTLKLGYNRVHGYYIEISKGQAARAPAEYVRRQTLKAAERYITPELKAFEDKVLSARERALAREKHLYDGLLDRLLESLQGLQLSANALAELDVLAAFAERAKALNSDGPRTHRGTLPRHSRRPASHRRTRAGCAVRGQRSAPRPATIIC